ncbi:RagB/SusD family nutrient uptake outer membrane protein [Petrimonas mucosa]|jgi:hypothetical protein|uniref:SusD/RagB family lipoprotein n=1 Tax=Petrimonas mucosa TaxID=1642646 RepID=A0A1G4G369_9BACT|nr:RagB/SusD family nutrient uptake outer membrane protein [Petrimonas mucosa]SCM55161.1 SusD/RagB family lipoprotein {ECO:0000313/EMBL:CAZ94339,1} [Petrimonas mucosa]SFU40396.1 SusD family protein [Porphyromonadaceae bacterium KHP3R9]
MKTTIKYLLLIFTLFTTISCNQDAFFELKRPNQFPWVNVNELELGVREPYFLLNRDPWSHAFGTIALKNFTESDIALFLPQFVGASASAAYYNREFSKAIPAYEMLDTFIKLYEMVTACNGPLQMLSDAEEAGEDPFPSMTQADRDKVNQFKGELLFMRGLAYWYLARMYAPPYNPNGNNDGRFFTLRREFTTSSEQLKKPVLGSVKEVYDAIEEDWTNAKNLLFEDHAPLVYDVNVRARANKYAASAMLMRLYFIKGEHDKALAECNYILNSPMYDLTEEPIQAFNKNGKDGWGREVIWQTACDEISGAYGRMETIYTRSHFSSTSMAAWASQPLSHWALKQVGWMNEDLSETEEARNDKRYQQIYFRYDEDPRSPTVGPMVWSHKWFRAPDQRRSNRPLIRLAEVYLTRSIILFNKNDKVGAAADLNVVRNRAGLANIDPNALTADMIHNERIKEMATENGDRTYYLIGLQLPIGIGDRDPGKFSPVMPPYSEYYWQVPIVEQDQNQSYHDN